MEQELKHVVAQLFDVEVDRIDGTFRLATRRMQGSLARAKLDAAIRHRFGIKSRGVYTAQTFDDLHAAVFGGAVNGDHVQMVSENQPAGNATKSSVPALALPADMRGAVRCGIDIEMVENFPEVADYWHEGVYASAFTPDEIAYCLLQEYPPMHFAARWCAKEALKKCDPAYLHEDMSRMELVHHDQGTLQLRHYVDGVPATIPVAVSISHTTTMAIAIVLK